MPVWKWPRSDQQASPPHLVATTRDRRLGSVEMTHASPAFLFSFFFGEPIKDGLSPPLSRKAAERHRERQRNHWKDARQDRNHCFFAGGGEEVNRKVTSYVLEDLSWVLKKNKKLWEQIHLRGGQVGGRTTQMWATCSRRTQVHTTKLAAHLGCRSHRWKMPTSSPDISSGKTRSVLCFFSIFIRRLHLGVNTNWGFEGHLFKTQLWRF